MILGTLFFFLKRPYCRVSKTLFFSTQKNVRLIRRTGSGPEWGNTRSLGLVSEFWNRVSTDSVSCKSCSERVRAIRAANICGLGAKEKGDRSRNRLALTPETNEGCSESCVRTPSRLFRITELLLLLLSATATTTTTTTTKWPRGIISRRQSVLWLAGWRSSEDLLLATREIQPLHGRLTAKWIITCTHTHTHALTQLDMNDAMRASERATDRPTDGTTEQPTDQQPRSQTEESEVSSMKTRWGVCLSLPRGK